MIKNTDFLFVFMVILIGNILTLNNALSEENHHGSHAHVHGVADANIAMLRQISRAPERTPMKTVTDVG